MTDKRRTVVKRAAKFRQADLEFARDVTATADFGQLSSNWIEHAVEAICEGVPVTTSPNDWIATQQKRATADKYESERALATAIEAQDDCANGGRHGDNSGTKQRRFPPCLHHPPPGEPHGGSPKTAVPRHS
jgi:hypothetical protein